MIKILLRIVHAQKETREGKRIPYRVVSGATGVNISVISDWMNNKVSLIRKDVLETFCRYYEVKPGDILVLEDN